MFLTNNNNDFIPFISVKNLDLVHSSSDMFATKDTTYNGVLSIPYTSSAICGTILSNTTLSQKSITYNLISSTLTSVTHCSTVLLSNQDPFCVISTLNDQLLLNSLLVRYMPNANIAMMDEQIQNLTAFKNESSYSQYLPLKIIFFFDGLVYQTQANSILFSSADGSILSNTLAYNALYSLLFNYLTGCGISEDEITSSGLVHSLIVNANLIASSQLALNFQLSSLPSVADIISLIPEFAAISLYQTSNGSNYSFIKKCCSYYQSILNSYSDVVSSQTTDGSNTLVAQLKSSFSPPINVGLQSNLVNMIESQLGVTFPNNISNLLISYFMLFNDGWAQYISQLSITNDEGINTYLKMDLLFGFYSSNFKNFEFAANTMTFEIWDDSSNQCASAILTLPIDSYATVFTNGFNLFYSNTTCKLVVETYILILYTFYLFINGEEIKLNVNPTIIDMPYSLQQQLGINSPQTSTDLILS